MNVLTKKNLMNSIIHKIMEIVTIYVMEKGKIIFKIVVNALLIQTMKLN